MRAACLALCLLALPVTVAAEIRFSGDARMGVVRDRGSDTGGSDRDTRALAATRLLVELSRETDSGLRFGVLLGVSGSRLPDRGPRD